MEGKKAFTLVEVVVSVILLATVGVILLQTNSNSIQNFIYLKDRTYVEKIASIPAIEYEERYHKSKTSLFALIEDDFVIQNDELAAQLQARYVFFDRNPILQADFINPSDKRIPTNSGVLRLDEVTTTLIGKKSTFFTFSTSE